MDVGQKNPLGNQMDWTFETKWTGHLARTLYRKLFTQNEKEFFHLRYRSSLTRL